MVSRTRNFQAPYHRFLPGGRYAGDTVVNRRSPMRWVTARDPSDPVVYWKAPSVWVV